MALGNLAGDDVLHIAEQILADGYTAGPEAGGSLTIDGEQLGDFDYVCVEGPVVVDGSNPFDAGDWFTGTEDSRSAWVVVDGDLTIGTGQVFRPPVRKLFTVVYVTGALTVDGELSMSQRGANHSAATGSNITAQRILIASGDVDGVTDPHVPAAGASGSPAPSSNSSGQAGGDGTGGQTGGGGSGAASGTGGAAGAAGTSFSGGPGSGANRDITPEAGQPDGGKGGDARGTDGSVPGNGGGAGNPGGAGAGTGQAGGDGTGGVLIVRCLVIDGSGSITAQGAPGGDDLTNGAQGGGGSGGGSITVLAGGGSGPTLDASGGAGGQGQRRNGGRGGHGTARQLTLTIPTWEILRSALIAVQAQPLTWAKTWPLDSPATVTTAARSLVWAAKTRPGVYPPDIYPPVVYPNPALAPTYVARLVDGDHNEITRWDLDGRPAFNLRSIRERLNEAPECTAVVPKAHPATKLAVPLSTILQVFRDGDLVFVGRVVGRDIAGRSGEVTLTAKGRLWDLEQLVFGSANRRNLYRNGTFVDGLADWSVIGDITAEIGTAHWLRDGQAVRLSNNHPGENYYLRQSRAWRTNFPVGQLLTAVAWCRITEWGGPAHEERGLMLVYRDEHGQAIAQGVARIDDATRRDDWVRLQTEVVTPPFIDGRLDIHLYAPGGRIYWDDARVVMMESTTSGNYPVGNDQAETARRIVREAHSGRANPDLNLGTNTPPTGRVEHYAWQHADHEQIIDALRTLVDHPDGIDISIESTPVSDTFTTHYPMRGVDRRDTVTLTPVRSVAGSRVGNLADWRWTDDGLRTATDIIALGDAHGPSREEGLFRDRSEVDGFAAMRVVQAPRGTPINELDGFAAIIGETTRRIQVAFEVHLVDPALCATLGVGDVVTVDIDDQAFEATGGWRIVESRWEPDGTRWLVLNRFPDEEGS